MARAGEAGSGPGAAWLFAADEEVGRDLAAVDWAATPLGLPESWPQSLQTAVDILLSSRFSMWMAWGPQLTFFCNAAYRRDTLGRKYPWALGRPASMAEHAQDHPDHVADDVMSAMTPTAGYEDDVAVLIYRHPPAPLTVEVPADDPSCLALLRARLRQWLPAAGIGSQEAIDIMIAAGEATANAFEHAAAGRPDGAAPVQITLTARATHTMVQLTVTDTGSWRSPPADREQPAPGTRGHGIIFMRALMNGVTINPSAHGTTVTLTKDLNHD